MSASLLFCPLQPFIVNYILLYCQELTGTYFFSEYMYSHHTAFLLSSCYPVITWQLLADDIFQWVSAQIFRLRVYEDKDVYHWG